MARQIVSHRWERLLLVALLCASLGSLGFGPPVLVDGRYPPLRLWPEQVSALERLAQPPAITATAGMMVDLDAGQTLYSRHAHDALPPASTVKIMTALLTLQQADLADPVWVSPHAAATGGSRMGLVPGETLTVLDLLYGLLLPSGNDAAVALAEHVAGDQAAFVAGMNRAGAALDLAETHFVNPHGLDDPAQTTSAADLVKLTQAALAYPAFADIVSRTGAQVAGRSLTGTNELLAIYPGADGVKTGTTAAAGECLVASVTRRGHRLLVVVLGSQDRYADVRALLDFAASGWRWAPVALADNALAWEQGVDGRSYRLRAAENGGIFLPAWQWQVVQPLRVIDGPVPGTGTTPLGSLRLTLGGQVLAEVPLSVWRGP